MQDITPYYKEYTIADEDIISPQEVEKYFQNQLKEKITPKQHLQIITIKGQKIPIATHLTKDPDTKCKGTQGIVEILKSTKDTRTLRTIIQEHADTIINEYNQTKHKKITQRTDEEYYQIVNKYAKQYEKQLKLDPVSIKHKYMITNKLGYASKNNTISLNKYMKYMEEKTIQYVIYHELCHIYTYKHHHTLGHGKEFRQILQKEYTPQQEQKILQNNIIEG